TLVPTTYLVDTTLSNSSDSDQTVQAVRLRKNKSPQCKNCGLFYSHPESVVTAWGHQKKPHKMGLKIL
ncbi:hypothetical protein ACVZWM_004628, partial [Escherichia coli]